MDVIASEAKPSVAISNLIAEIASADFVSLAMTNPQIV